jgi:transcriptional regulator with XRE-family HTH domain
MKIDELIPFEQLLERHLRDPEFRAQWERLAPARAVANRLILYRADHGLTQTALAQLLGMSQSTIARLEIGEHIPTLPTLLKLLEVLDLEIMVTMTPAGQHRNGSAQELPEGRITEQITTSHGASMTIAIRSISAADYCASA